MPTPEEVVRAIDRRCRGPLRAEAVSEITAALEAGDAAAAGASDAAGRAGCGYDFNEIVLSNPLDGQEYAYTCPSCGVEGTYRAPRFDEPTEP